MKYLYSFILNINQRSQKLSPMDKNVSNKFLGGKGERENF